MSQSVSPKNIDPVLVDIRRPGIRHDPHAHHPVVHLEHDPHRPEPGSRILKRVVMSVLILITVVLVGGGLFVAKNVADARRIFSEGGGKIVDNFLRSLDALGNFDPGTASARLKENEGTFSSLEQFLNNRFGGAVVDIASGLVPVVGEGRDLLVRVASLNGNFLSLSDAFGELQSNGFRYFRSDGPRLLALLERIRTLVGTIRTQAQDVKNLTSRLRVVVPALVGVDDALSDYYVRRSAELDELERFMAGMVNLLGSSDDHHLLLLFQNPGELRPGGGFIGSYADVTVREGQLQSIDVRDTYDPDGQLDINVIPPRELWTITERWGARDANWFFDFPLSAKTTVGFLEASKIYSERSVRFEGAMAMNINVFRTILGIVGPIELPEYSLTVTPDNFLNEIQREVESGKDKTAGEPKRILKVLAPIVLDRLSSLAPEAQKALIAGFDAHLAKKDVMFYAKDPVLAAFLAAQGVDGAVTPLPNGFWGSYLAVVDTNVAGGKSDAFVSQALDARFDVSTDGKVLMDLMVTRSHHGEKEKDAWWRATNQNYLQVLVNPSSNLVGLTGNDTKLIAPSVDYATSGFVTNPDLEAIENARNYSSGLKTWTGDAFGKTVFGTWMNVAAGKTKTVEVRSQSPTPADFSLQPGKKFTFIFDRQSGVSTTLQATILAPIGYSWTETQNPYFAAKFENPDARVTIELTLAK